MPATRREFLDVTARGALCFLGAAPLFRKPAHTSRKGPQERILVLLQLSGGNDGVSTVIPYADDAYGRNRKRTRRGASEVLKLDDYVGLHPGLKAIHELYQEGKLSVLQGIGYPHPIRSHFKSMDIWQAADPRGRQVGTGWVGRFVDSAFMNSENPNLVIHVGNRIPFSLEAAIHRPVAFVTPQAYKWTGSRRERQALKDAAPISKHAPPTSGPHAGRDSALARIRKLLREAQISSARVRKAEREFRPKVSFPTTALGRSLVSVAALIAEGMGTRVYSVEMGGFDTHVNQRPRHDRLMAELGGGLGAFFQELEARGLDKRVCLLAFSEFGRRLRENGSAGTDHGVASQAFLLGGGVRGGLVGRYPSLEDLDRGDLIHNLDFRAVYATIISRWFKKAHEPVLGRHWKTLPLFKS